MFLLDDGGISMGFCYFKLVYLLQYIIKGLVIKDSLNINDFGEVI
jgi:hypothetical protein